MRNEARQEAAAAAAGWRGQGSESDRDQLSSAPVRPRRSVTAGQRPTAEFRPGSNSETPPLFTVELLVPVTDVSGPSLCL